MLSTTKLDCAPWGLNPALADQSRELEEIGVATPMSGSHDPSMS
jgi:hypothetical protein